MTTFADMITLLLTFFVLLFTIAEMDLKKYTEIMKSIRKEFGATAAPALGVKTESATLPPVAPPKEAAKQIIKDLEKLVSDKNLQEDVEVLNTKRGVLLRVKEKMLFTTGEAELSPASYPVLDELLDITGKSSYLVSIEGHTDAQPVRGGVYHSNWELSTARAIAVLNYFKDKKKIDTKKIRIVGYADSQPLDQDDTPQARARNRRVEFVFSEN